MRILHTIVLMAMLASLQLLTGCSGKLYILATPPPICNLTCPPGYSCSENKCVINSSNISCNPVNLDGYCPPDEQCIAGTCYPLTALPTACSTSATSGWCQNANQACLNGTCTDIAA